MLNQLVLVGRLVREPELKEYENEKKKSVITIAVPRNYKNADGEYETDFIDCELWGNVAQNTVEYCKQGDMVGIKGRLKTRILENDEGARSKRLEVVAEKVTFLQQSKNHQQEKTDEER